jgi:hypothetical protein
MQRRAFSCSLGGMVVTTILREVNGSKDRLMTIHPLAASTPPTLAASSWPRELAGIKFVDTRYTSLAIRTLASTSPGFLVNHAARTFYFGALIGNARGLAFDHELLFLACALHDLGLTELHMGPLPFELQGAEVASKLLANAGLEGSKASTVWDGIAMHPTALADFKPAEVSLVAAGAGADVVGNDLERISPDAVAEVIAAFPRLDFKRQFIRSCAKVVERFPRAASRSFMRDIGERHVASFRPRNICDAIEKSPFSE